MFGVGRRTWTTIGNAKTKRTSFEFHILALVTIVTRLPNVRSVDWDTYGELHCDDKTVQGREIRREVVVDGVNMNFYSHGRA